jgi:FKBP-type peptidyl-prolyl cis-trans isomerase FklB
MPRRTASLIAVTLIAFGAPALATNEAGKKYLAEKAKEPGVVTLPSGLLYKVLREGGGDSHPTADSSCSCHYAGTLIDGTEFDSSYGRGDPTDFAPNQVIKGWTEAMQLMVEGDKWEMYIPSELAYGEGGSPPKIPGGSALVFQMEIIKINGDKVPAERCDPINENKGCSAMEIKYIEKIQGKYGDDLSPITDVLSKVEAAGKKGKKELSAWMKGELGIKVRACMRAENSTLPLTLSAGGVAQERQAVEEVVQEDQETSGEDGPGGQERALEASTALRLGTDASSTSLCSVLQAFRCPEP